MKKISRAEAVSRIEAAKDSGYFCSAIVKRRRDSKDGTAKAGELRTFNFRGGVRKGVKGVGLPFEPKAHKLITVWDKLADGQAGNFRMIAIEGIQKIKIEHEEFEVVD